MSQFQVGDLVWIPDLTNAYTQATRRGNEKRYNIEGPIYGLVLEVNSRDHFNRVKVSVGKGTGKLSFPEKLWFKESEIYKHDGDAYGKIC